MNALWTRIGLGAVGVFAVGMVAVGMVHRAADSVGSRIGSLLEPPVGNTAVDAVIPTAAERAAAPMARLAGLSRIVGAAEGQAGRGMTFRLDGHEIGTIRRMVIQRTNQGEIPAMNMSIELTDDAAATALEHCDQLLAIDHGDGMDSGFRCARADAPGTVAVGWARFSPGNESRPIAVTSRATRDLRKGDPFKVSIEGDGNVDVTGGDDSGEVHIHADQFGARINVQDGLGKALFGLLADSTGANLRVRGKNGKDIVRMEARDGHFSLVVDTSAAH